MAARAELELGMRAEIRLSYVTSYMNEPRSELHTYGGLFLASRLRRLSELLYAATNQIYREHGVTIPSGSVALLLLLRDHGDALSIGELAGRMGPELTESASSARPGTRATSGG